MSRTRNSAWSIASTLLFTGVSVACFFLSTRFLLPWLGSERFGVFKVLTDWIGYLVLFDLGLGGALLARLGPQVGRSDHAAVRATLASGVLSYLPVMAITLTAGLALVAFLPWAVHTHGVPTRELRGATLISLVPVLLTPLLVFRALADARQRTFLFGLLMTLQSLLVTGLCLGAARAGWGLIGQSLATTLAQLPIALVLMQDGTRAYGRVRLAHAALEFRLSIAVLRLPSFIHSLADRIGLVSDSVIVAWLLGPLAVTPFYLTQSLALVIQAQLRGVSNATWAGLVELHAQGQHALFRQRVLELTGIVSGLGIAVLGPVAACNHLFVQHWVGAIGFAGNAVTLLACVNAWLWALFSLWSWPILGAGFIGRWGPYAAVFTVVNVLVSIGATRLLGMIGPLFGSTAGFLLVDAWAMPLVLFQVFAFAPGTLWRTALAPLAWGLPYAAVLWFVVQTHPPVGWVGLGAEMTAFLAGGLILWWRLGVNAEMRSTWQRRLQESVFPNRGH